MCTVYVCLFQALQGFWCVWNSSLERWESLCSCGKARKARIILAFCAFKDSLVSWKVHNATVRAFLAFYYVHFSLWTILRTLESADLRSPGFYAHRDFLGKRRPSCFLRFQRFLGFLESEESQDGSRFPGFSLCVLSRIPWFPGFFAHRDFPGKRGKPGRSVFSWKIPMCKKSLTFCAEFRAFFAWAARPLQWQWSHQRQLLLMELCLWVR